MAKQQPLHNPNNVAAKATFLAHLMTGKSVKASAEAAGVGRRTFYDWRDMDAEFREAWEDAITGSVEVLEDEVRDRALDRTDKNSHILLMFLVKKHKPEYRENYKSEVHLVRDTVQEFDFSKVEIDEAVAILQEAANREDKPSP
jgi:AcrR family transcriptional regulator